MNPTSLSALVAVAALGAALPVRAQRPGPDDGVLAIRREGREVGGETFQVDSTDTGLRITAHAVYGAQRPATEFTASLDHGPGADLAFQLSRRAGDAGTQIYVVQKRNRVTVRQVGRGRERASELPGGPNVVVLSDSVFSLYLQVVPLATTDGAALTAIFPQGARRVGFTATRTASGTTGQVRLTGGIEGEIDLGNAGEVVRIFIPATGLEAVRKAP